MKTRLFCSTLAVLLLLPLTGRSDDNGEQPDTKVALNPLEKQFQQSLSGAALVGHFTSGPVSAEEPLTAEEYTISRVVKLPGKDDQWRFFVRIKYGEFDVQLPINLAVKWAGDTPVITLTDLTVPPLGTFSARVLIYRNQYAGTWHHGRRGGQLFGRVVTKAEQAEDASDGSDKEDGAAGPPEE